MRSSGADRAMIGGTIAMKGYLINHQVAHKIHIMATQIFSDELRRQIERSSKSRYRIWKETGVSQESLCRFLQGGGLSLGSIDLVCQCLGLQLVLKDRSVVKKTKKRRST